METNFSLTTIKAIIGLGNPGQQYAKNRHNIGFRIVDEFVEQSGGSWRTTSDMAIAEIQVPSASGSLQSIIAIKPQTYMNNSGRVVSFLQKKGIKPEEILVIHDELEKSFGATQIRLGGSARGHNGLKSIIGSMGDGFWRLRFGIGRPADKAEVSNYVLTNFDRDEEQQISELVQKISTNLTSSV